MIYIALFFAGAFLCNCIPHLAAGLRGEYFPTPFAKPRGVGLSAPVVNFIWGCANVMTAGTILVRRGFPTAVGPALFALVTGFLVMGVYLSIHFGKTRRSSTGN
jgi:hypothetical protein